MTDYFSSQTAQSPNVCNGAALSLAPSVQSCVTLLHSGHEATELTASRQILPLHERCSRV